MMGLEVDEDWKDCIYAAYAAMGMKPIANERLLRTVNSQGIPGSNDFWL
jgi:hypothetical protein